MGKMPEAQNFLIPPRSLFLGVFLSSRKSLYLSFLENNWTWVLFPLFFRNGMTDTGLSPIHMNFANNKAALCCSCFLVDFAKSDQIRSRGYKTFFMHNSVENEIFPAHKC